MKYRVALDRENDGRWIADVAELPGVMCYGSTQVEAVRAAEALAFRVLADRVEHGGVHRTGNANGEADRTDADTARGGRKASPA